MKPELKAFFLSGLLFAFAMFFCFWLTTKSIYIAAITALISGLFFSIMMQIVGKGLKKRFETNPPQLETDEEISYSAPANCLRGFEGVGGFLYLTSRRLLFRPHSFNIQKEELSLPLSVIREATSDKKTLGVLDNRLTVTDSSSIKHSFIVYYPKVWVEKLTAMRSVP